MTGLIKKRRILRRFLVLACSVGILVGTGCGPGGGRTPEATLNQFADALGDRRYRDAYDLMSDRYRQRVSFQDFERHLNTNPDEASTAARALNRPDGPAEQVATITYAEGEELTLTNEGDGWRISSNVVDFYDQSTPRSALRSFVRAMERERYDVVLRMVPEADLEGMNEDRMRESWSGEAREEVDRLVANLRANLNSPIEEVGDRATMRYGDRFTATLLREDGVWKVEDPD